MALIIWDNAVPSDTSAGALPAPFSMQSIPHSMRTMKEAIATGFGEAFYWPGSAASQGASAESSGEMRIGSSRLMRGASDDELNAGGSLNGYLGLVYQTGGSGLGGSNTYIQHIGSENTHLIASTGIEEVIAIMDINSTTVNTAKIDPRYIWTVDEGAFSVSEEEMGEFNESVTFNVTYDVPPFVFMSVDSAAMSYGVDQVTTTGFISRGSQFGSDAVLLPGSVKIQWRSEGTISV